MKKADYELKAIQYCEKYGITSYKVDGCKLIYYSYYPAYLNNKAEMYKTVVNLRSGEVTRKQTRVMRRYIK